MRAARIALLLAVGLVPAASAHADVTIGSALPAPATTVVPCQGGCTVAMTAVPGQTVNVPAPGGVITRWRLRSGAVVTPVRLQVIRPSGGTAVEVNHSATVTPPVSQVTFFATRQPILPGDLLAIEIANDTPEYFAPTPGATVDIWSDPALSTAARAPTDGAQPNIEPLVNADVEADADTDGYGDETQDNCPVDANPTQADLDHDGAGNACDSDDDGDGVPDATDDCDTIVGPAPRGCPPPPPPPPNRAPTVRFRAPLAGTAVGPSFRIVLDAADDRGAPTVTVFDDDGTICVLRRAPYACTWTPTGDDVGRATLLASAVDSAGLSTLGIVRVRVRRFETSLTQRQRHRKGVTRVSGRLVLPAGVTRAQGCEGTVRIRLRKARRTAAVTRRCTYSAKLPFRPGRARVRFSGNSVLAPT